MSEQNRQEFGWCPCCNAVVPMLPAPAAGNCVYCFSHTMKLYTCDELDAAVTKARIEEYWLGYISANTTQSELKHLLAPASVIESERIKFLEWYRANYWNCPDSAWNQEHMRFTHSDINLAWDAWLASKKVNAKAASPIIIEDQIE